MHTIPSKSEVFTNERADFEWLAVRYTNWGDPFQEGVSFDLRSDDLEMRVSLTEPEVRRLYAFLGRLLGEN